MNSIDVGKISQVGLELGYTGGKSTINGSDLLPDGTKKYTDNINLGINYKITPIDTDKVAVTAQAGTKLGMIYFLTIKHR